MSRRPASADRAAAVVGDHQQSCGAQDPFDLPRRLVSGATWWKRVRTRCTTNARRMRLTAPPTRGWHDPLRCWRPRSLPSPSSNGFYLGPLFVHAYGLAYVAAVIAAIAIVSRCWQARGGDPALVREVAMWGFPAGIVGGRLYFLVTTPSQAPHAWWGPLAIWRGGLGIWGGRGGWHACGAVGVAPQAGGYSGVHGCGGSGAAGCAGDRPGR